MTTSGGLRLLDDPAFGRLKCMAEARTGVGSWAGREEALADGLSVLLARRHLSAAQWAACLTNEAGHGPETDALIDAVTVGETFFFRSQDQFHALERVVIPEVLARKRRVRRLNLWSAGCSNGAEAYSLSILLHRSFAAALEGWAVRIMGTDINRYAVIQAERGLFGAWYLRGLPPSLIDECFERWEGKWHLRQRYRQNVTFQVHNLTTLPAPGSAFDVVLCRNVLMYLALPSRARTVEVLYGALAPGGWLVVGHAEVGGAVGRLFSEHVVEGCTLYRKPLALGGR